MPSQFRISVLADVISRNTATLEKWFNDNNIRQPSFEADGPLLEEAFPPEVVQARLQVEDATLELRQLVIGPRAIFKDVLINEIMASDTIYHANIVHHVPLNDIKGISYAELSNKCGVAQHALEKIMRAAIANRLFLEPSPGRVAHSAASRLWATDPLGDDWAGFYIEEGVHMMPYIWKALEKYPEADEPDRTASSLLEQAERGGELQTFYGMHEKDPPRAKRFGGVMSGFLKDDGYSMRHAVNGYDWAALPKGSTVVDLGGSYGEVATAVTNKFPHLNFVVQDLTETINSAPKVNDGVPIKFMAHDFFQEQPVKGADVYFFRWILHNWSDKYGVQILNALQPALKKGSRIVFMDVVVPPIGVLPNTVDRQVRWMDVAMMALFNAGDRTAEQWERLLKKASPGYKFNGIQHVPGSKMSFIEAFWQPEADGAL